MQRTGIPGTAQWVSATVAHGPPPVMAGRPYGRQVPAAPHLSAHAR